MFLLGGTAFSGKTLLAHLLNQGRVVCLDEPDFHDPGQSHRGIPFLETLFPGKTFPNEPDRQLTFAEAVALIERCEEAIRPCRLGMKTAGWVFVEYAKIYRASGWPVIAVVRDIRDVLAEATLPEWVGGEQGLNRSFRSIWANLNLCDLWIRYEDLVMHPEAALARIARLLAHELTLPATWHAESVHHTMFKLDRHELLRSGRISSDRVGIWKTSARTFSDDTAMTATMMGYGEG
jgi:hypothetical protein